MHEEIELKERKKYTHRNTDTLKCKKKVNYKHNNYISIKLYLQVK